MHIIQVRLFELQLKGDRLDEINAEEILDRRAASHARVQAVRSYIRRIYQQFTVRFAKQPQANTACSMSPGKIARRSWPI